MLDYQKLILVINVINAKRSIFSDPDFIAYFMRIMIYAKFVITIYLNLIIILLNTSLKNIIYLSLFNKILPLKKIVFIIMKEMIKPMIHVIVVTLSIIPSQADDILHQVDLSQIIQLLRDHTLKKLHLS